MKNSFEDIYAVVRLIPFGKVSTYGEIAAYLGNKRAARMVGWAMNASHGDSSIPAHRVVNRNGLLSGKAFFGGNKMQDLLENEGIVILDNKIQNFKDHLWSPNDELL